MNRQETRAAFSLASVFSIRLLGLFMIYPSSRPMRAHLHGATPAKIGLALGAYGLSQGLLQIPFGVLSDRVGRKAMVVDRPRPLRAGQRRRRAFRPRSRGC